MSKISVSEVSLSEVDVSKLRVSKVNASEMSLSKVSVSVYTTTHYDSSPIWMREHHRYIKRGYRRPANSFVVCLQSLFYPHNESVNIWSHLFPGLCYLLSHAMIDDALILQNTQNRMADRAVVQFYIAGTAACLLLSASYHCISSHSYAVARHLIKLDYLGITINITMGNVASTYFGLREDPVLQNRYISISLACAAIVLFTMLDPRCDGHRAAHFRVVMFAALLSSGIAPIVHKGVASGFDSLESFSLAYTGITLSCYFLASVFYVLQWPECRWAGTFDILGASHQIFHCLVVLGQFIFLLGIRNSLLMQKNGI